MKQLKNRVAVVTGGASGIGRAIAERFAANGMKVVIADIEPSPREETVKALRSTGAEVVGMHCDVANAASVANVAHQVDSTLRSGAHPMQQCRRPAWHFWASDLGKTTLGVGMGSGRQSVGGDPWHPQFRAAHAPAW